MHVEFNDGILYLTAKNKEEETFLKQAFHEGLRVFGGGSCTTLALPSMANLEQLHLNPTQKNRVIYALGKTDRKLQHTYGHENVNRLLSEIFRMAQEES